MMLSNPFFSRHLESVELRSKKRGNIMMAVLIIMGGLTISVAALQWMMPEISKDTSKARDELQIHLGLNSALDYAIATVRKRWCLTPELTKSNSCGIEARYLIEHPTSTDSAATERLLWSKSTRESLLKLRMDGLLDQALKYSVRLTDPEFWIIRDQLETRITTGGGTLLTFPSDLRRDVSSGFFPNNLGAVTNANRLAIYKDFINYYFNSSYFPPDLDPAPEAYDPVLVAPNNKNYGTIWRNELLALGEDQLRDAAKCPFPSGFSHRWGLIGESRRIFATAPGAGGSDVTITAVHKIFCRRNRGTVANTEKLNLRYVVEYPDLSAMRDEYAQYRGLLELDRFLATPAQLPKPITVTLNAKALPEGHELKNALRGFSNVEFTFQQINNNPHLSDAAGASYVQIEISAEADEESSRFKRWANRLARINLFKAKALFAFYPRELSSFGLVLGGDLRLDTGSAAVCHSRSGSMCINPSEGEPNRFEALRFQSPIYIHDNLVLPDTSAINRVSFQAPIVLGTGGVKVNRGGALTDFRPGILPSFGTGLTSRLFSSVKNIGGVLQGFRIDGYEDKGLTFLRSGGTSGATTIELIESCRQWAKSLSALSGTKESELLTLFKGVESPTANNWRADYLIGLSLNNRFKAQIRENAAGENELASRRTRAPGNPEIGRFLVANVANEVPSELQVNLLNFEKLNFSFLTSSDNKIDVKLKQNLFDVTPIQTLMTKITADLATVPVRRANKVTERDNRRNQRLRTDAQQAVNDALAALLAIPGCKEDPALSTVVAGSIEETNCNAARLNWEAKKTDLARIDGIIAAQIVADQAEIDTLDSLGVLETDARIALRKARTRLEWINANPAGIEVITKAMEIPDHTTAIPAKAANKGKGMRHPSFIHFSTKIQNPAAILGRTDDLNLNSHDINRFDTLSESAKKNLIDETLNRIRRVVAPTDRTIDVAIGAFDLGYQAGENKRCYYHAVNCPDESLDDAYRREGVLRLELNFVDWENPASGVYQADGTFDPARVSSANLRVRPNVDGTALTAFRRSIGRGWWDNLGPLTTDDGFHNYIYDPATRAPPGWEDEHVGSREQLWSFPPPVGYLPASDPEEKALLCASALKAATWATDFSDRSDYSWHFSSPTPLSAIDTDPEYEMPEGNRPDAEFTVQSIRRDCVIRASTRYVMGFFHCKNLRIEPREIPLTIRGTIIVSGSAIIPNAALKHTIRWSSIYYPDAVREMRTVAAGKILRPVPGENGTCPSEDIAALGGALKPEWYPNRSPDQETSSYYCSPVSIRAKAIPFQWTAVDPDCGIIETSQHTSCKKQIKNYLQSEISRQVIQ
jgi:hypothetical protein